MGEDSVKFLAGALSQTSVSGEADRDSALQRDGPSSEIPVNTGNVPQFK
jgi:hypothetical protein